MALSGYRFSKRERVLLIVLLVIALGMLWYFAVFTRCQDNLQKATNQQSTIQTSIDTATLKKTKMTKMQNEIAAAKLNGSTATALPLYDNVVNLTDELNGILAAANTYSLNFEGVETSNGIARRKVTLTYTAASYDQATSILSQISGGQYKCMLGDLAITDSNNSSKTSTSSNAIALSSSSSSAAAGPVSVNVSLTFFESTKA